MRRVRRVARSPLFILFVLANFLNFACNREEVQGDISASRVERPAQDLSKEAIFKSIIFADGPLTAHIKPLRTLNLDQYFTDKKDWEQYRKLEAEAIEFIRERNPQFLSEFKSSMLSKDPVEIDHAIREVDNYLTPFANEKLKVHGLSVDKLVESVGSAVKKGDAASLSAESEACVAIFEVFAIGIYVLIGIAILVVAAYGKPSAELFRKELSISIAENL